MHAPCRPAASGLQLEHLVSAPAVLAADRHFGALGCAAEVCRALKKALAAAVEAEGEPGDGSVGDCLKGGAKATVDGADLAVEGRCRSGRLGRRRCRAGRSCFRGPSADRPGLRAAFRAAGFLPGDSRSPSRLGSVHRGSGLQRTATRVQGSLMWALSINSVGAG